MIIFATNFLLTIILLFSSYQKIFFILCILIINFYLLKIYAIISYTKKIKKVILEELKQNKLINLNFVFEFILKSKKFYF